MYSRWKRAALSRAALIHWLIYSVNIHCTPNKLCWTTGDCFCSRNVILPSRGLSASCPPPAEISEGGQACRPGAWKRRFEWLTTVGMWVLPLSVWERWGLRPVTSHGSGFLWPLRKQNFNLKSWQIVICLFCVTLLLLLHVTAFMHTLPQCMYLLPPTQSFGSQRAHESGIA